jgi:hypothetical protein
VYDNRGKRGVDVCDNDGRAIDLGFESCGQLAR